MVDNKWISTNKLVKFVIYISKFNIRTCCKFLSLPSIVPSIPPSFPWTLPSRPIFKIIEQPSALGLAWLGGGGGGVAEYPY